MSRRIFIRVLLVPLCLSALAQEGEFQNALRRSGNSEFQRGVLLAKDRAGAWAASLNSAQSTAFSRWKIDSLILNVRIEVTIHDCKWGIEPADKCHPAPLATSIRELFLELRGVDYPGGVERIYRVKTLEYANDRLQLEAAWPRGGENVAILVDAAFSSDGRRFSGTVSCGGKSAPVTFGRMKSSGSLFLGDWISEGHIIGVFHIRALGSGEMMATFDQITGEHADLGIPFAAEAKGNQLQLSFEHGNGRSEFFAALSADHASLNGDWHWSQLADGNSFRRLNRDR